MNKDKNTYGSNFGKRLQEARLRRNLKQYELSEKTGLTQAVIARLERGGVDNPGAKTLNKIYSALNLSFSEIRNLTRDIAFEDETRVRKIIDSPEYDRYGKENEKLSYDIKMSIPEDWFLSENISKELIDYILPKLDERELNKVAALAYSLLTVRSQGYLVVNDDLNRIISKTGKALKYVEGFRYDVAVLVYSKSKLPDIYERPDVVINKGNKILEEVLGKYIKAYDIISYNYDKSIIYGGLEAGRLLKEIKEISEKENKRYLALAMRSLERKINDKVFAPRIGLEDIRIICDDKEESPGDYFGRLDTRWLLNKFNEFDMYNNGDSIFNNYALVKYKVIYKN